MLHLIGSASHASPGPPGGPPGPPDVLFMIETFDLAILELFHHETYMFLMFYFICFIV